jgi:hypothetical protein
MKPIHPAIVLFLAASALCFAEEPSLSVYQILHEAPLTTGAELIMKVRNPPGRNYYILGLTMSDVPYVMEIQKDGKWVPAPQPHALSEFRLRPFLPDSYLVFGIPIQMQHEDAVFRVRIFLYTASELSQIYPGSPDNSVVEVVSGPFSTKDFR